MRLGYIVSRLGHIVPRNRLGYIVSRLGYIVSRLGHIVPRNRLGHIVSR